MSANNSRVAMEWVTIGAFVSALVAGSFVFMLLERSESTDCYYESIQITIADSEDLVEGCQDLKTFQSVNAHIADERKTAAGADAAEADYVVEEPDSAAGRGNLAVWIALFTATAATSGYALVRALVERRTVRPKKGQSVLDFVLVFCVVLGTFWVLGRQPFEFSDYEDMHTPVITYIMYSIGLMLIPALVTLIACGRATDPAKALDLKRVGTIGDTLRLMISLAGAVLALGVITTGARSEAIANLPGADPIPSSVTLIWGAVFAIALAIIYVPVHQRWSAALSRVVANEIRAQFGPMAQPATSSDEPAEIPTEWVQQFDPFRRDEIQIRRGDKEAPGTPGYRPAELSATKELRAALGAKGPLTVLQGSFSVLAPVIAAAVSSFFTG